jgi:predicted DNA-binding transcriptional regulator AlpA
MKPEEFIRIPAAANQLGITISDVYDLIEQGLPYSRDNEHRMLHVRLSDIEVYRARATT